MEKDFKQLLVDYRSIWNNRLLNEDDKESVEILLEAIRRDIKDENSHPRIRRTKYEKYYLATKRIIESQIPIDSKLALLEIHTRVMEE
ncbi:hypothetical protein [Pseudoneobacillus sp. C159]